MSIEGIRRAAEHHAKFALKNLYPHGYDPELEDLIISAYLRGITDFRESVKSPVIAGATDAVTEVLREELSKYSAIGERIVSLLEGMKKPNAR